MGWYFAETETLIIIDLKPKKTKKDRVGGRGEPTET